MGQRPPGLVSWPDEKLQLAHRLPAPLIRHLLTEIRATRLSAQAAALELKIHLSRLYQLRTDYLRACAQGHADTWTPGTSRRRPLP
jgi:hypothetical protein